MGEWNEEVRHFMAYWFTGLIKGLKSLNEPERKVILRECGKSCAESCTTEIFLEARRQSTDMIGFLSNLADSFPEARYEQIAPDTIRVHYTYCACDLVQCGLAEDPLICECSAFNLQENFEGALEISVRVTLERSILEGAPECVLLVSLENQPEEE